jgi:hypothetical protein
MTVIMNIGVAKHEELIIVICSNNTSLYQERLKISIEKPQSEELILF